MTIDATNMCSHLQRKLFDADGEYRATAQVARSKSSHWTELNKQRCTDLVRRGLMTKHGLQVIPD